MNKTKLLTIAVVGLLLLNFGTLAFMFFKQNNRRDHPTQGEGPKQLIIERLHFDDAQQKQYSIIVDEHRSKSRQLNQASREMHDELYSQLKDPVINKTKADSIIQKISDNQKEMDNLNFDHFQKIKAICRPEQIADYNNLVEDLSRLFAPHRQGRPPE